MADGKERPTYRTRRAAAQETRDAKPKDTMQSFQLSTALKRKRGEELASADLLMPGSNADGSEMVASGTDATQLPIAKGGLVRPEFAAMSVLASCHAAAVNSPAAARSVLSKHRAYIDPSLVLVLDTVGGYKLEGRCTPLHDSAKQGNSKILKWLIAAGGDVDSKDAYGATPLDVATDDDCRRILEQHASILVDVANDPGTLISAAIAHCATLSKSDLPRPATALSLWDYHLDSFFHWVPSSASHILSMKARDVYTAQVAANTQPFSELPDDCAGDILSFLKTTSTRTELLKFATHCSSPEARAWMHAVVVAAVVKGATAEFHSEFRAGSVTTVRKCFEKGADVDMRAEGNITALMSASIDDEAPVVELLLHAGADMEAKDERGYTALILAAQEGHTTILKLLLEAGADTEAEMNECGSTALIRARNARTSMETIVELLLRAGADKDAVNKDGSSALLYASLKGDVAVVKLLLEAGANRDIGKDKNNSALFNAARNGHDKIVKLLLMAGAETDIADHELGTALNIASMNNYIAIVELLLVADANKEAKNAAGNTPLISASFRGYTSIVELLLQAGADKDTKNRDDDTALTLAAEMGHTETVKVLLRASASKESKSNQDESMALFQAAGEGHADIVDLLLQAGADKDFSDEIRDTPLINASIGGHAAIVEYLLLAGANTNCVGEDGKTALILAIEYGHIDIVKYLLMAGADTEIKDCEYDSTALMWASTNDDAAVVKLLLRSGANMDVKDKEGQTALGCAHANGNKEVAALLQLWKPRPCA